MTLSRDSLILYKNRPARIADLDSKQKKLTIQTVDGQSLSVRPKDVLLLHAGPVRSLAELQSPAGEVVEAWELLAGTTTTIAELAELAYGDFTPAAAWAIWQLVDDGLYFSGEPEALEAHTLEAVQATQAARAAKVAEEQAWSAFLERLQAVGYLPEDEANLQDVVDLALERRSQSRVLAALGREETSANAHELLLAIGFWDATVNPYPNRQGVATASPELDLPPLAGGERLDLTHLFAAAIDDEGSRDPDDAVSWENGRLWVHIADAAALVTPGSPLDVEARARGANLYLPEGTVSMLPTLATDQLALGLTELSPALSFGIDVDDDGQIDALEIGPSWVQVTRLSYEQADERLDEEPFRQLYALAQRYQQRRRANGSIDLDLPEVRTRVEEGVISIRPILSLRSRDLVREAMLITGEAVAQFALEHGIAVPFSTQSAGDSDETDDLEGLAGMFALRKTLKPGRHRTAVSPHAGLGMDAYVQATSPLRRYSDLLVHQQLRAFLLGESLLDEQAVGERMAEAGMMMGAVRRAERFSNRHWKLVYLQRNPDWRGEGVVVEQRGARSLVVIPELDLDTELYGNGEAALNDVLSLRLSDVNLPALEARFQV